MTVTPEWLRQVVRDAVRELLDGGTTAPEVRDVSIGSDSELAAFVATLLELTRTLQGRAAVESGAVRFRLAGMARPVPERSVPERSGSDRPGSDRPDPGPRLPRARLVERGAVTEAVVTAAAAAGERIVLRAGGVVTPLARDAARRLSVPIEREA